MLETKSELEKRKQLDTFYNHSVWERFKKKKMKEIEKKGDEQELKKYKSYDDKEWEKKYAEDLEKIDGKLLERRRETNVNVLSSCRKNIRGCV